MGVESSQCSSAAGVIASAQSKLRTLLTELESKELLAAYGLHRGDVVRRDGRRGCACGGDGCEASLRDRDPQDKNVADRAQPDDGAFRVQEGICVAFESAVLRRRVHSISWA